MSSIKVGMIGYNEGNGHPYSFSAIINGYRETRMKKCPYPVIYDYLSSRKKSDFGIGNLKVTHVWAPNKDIANDIARCAYIDNIVDDYQEMLGETDAIIIARDDHDSHRDIAKIFLENGKSVFIDKPLCDNLDDLAYFKPWLKKGKLMSCSGFRYFPSIKNKMKGNLKAQEIVFSHNIGINSWTRYGIHLLEGITPILGGKVKWVQNFGEDGNDIVRIQYEDGKYAIFQTNEKLGFILRSSFFTSKQDHFTINYDDNFSCFKGLLLAFNEQIITGKPSIPPNETIKIIKAIIAGQKSLIKGGKRIYIKNLQL